MTYNHSRKHLPCAEASVRRRLCAQCHKAGKQRTGRTLRRRQGSLATVQEKTARPIDLAVYLYCAPNLVVERESLEDSDLRLLVDRCDSCLYGSLAISHLIFLLLEGVLLEELVQTAVGDIVDHCLRKIC